MTDALVLLARLLDLPPHLREFVFIGDVEIVDGTVVSFDVFVNLERLPPGSMATIEAAISGEQPWKS
jgi:hypothetical protein